ncbi:hypothetical protein [Roseococcus sp.]|uniref:hypothetical protein n=1 Tax=Roseococcus sp. TaxID=2109646 RepID=UPI003BAC53F5
MWGIASGRSTGGQECQDEAEGLAEGGWETLRLGSPSGAVPPAVEIDFALAHPDRGVALVDLAKPHPEAVPRLRARLQAAGFGDAFPGHLPIVHRVLGIDDLWRLSKVLEPAFALEPALGIAGQGWIGHVQHALLVEAPQAPRALPREEPSAPDPPLVREPLPPEEPVAAALLEEAPADIMPLARRRSRSALWFLLLLALAAGTGPAQQVTWPEAWSSHLRQLLPAIRAELPALFSQAGRPAAAPRAERDGDPREVSPPPPPPALASGAAFPRGPLPPLEEALLLPAPLVAVIGIPEIPRPALPPSLVRISEPVEPLALPQALPEAPPRLPIAAQFETALSIAAIELPPAPPVVGDRAPRPVPEVLVAAIEAAPGAASPTELATILVAQPPPALPSALINLLIQRGDEMLARGDVSAARLFYARAASAGSATAAWAMGRSFEPEVLSRIGARGIRADPDQARLWYRRAEEFH